MKDKPLFSVVLISKNEEKTLPRLLDSLEDFRERGGEIILVDTGSTDNTLRVAEKAGARIWTSSNYQYTISPELADAANDKFLSPGEPRIIQADDKLFDFAEARNFAAKYASNDFIAMPDCDEVYAKLDVDAVNRAILEGAQQLEYEFIFSHTDDGKPDVRFRHCKFYDRQKLKWEGIIHEVLVNTGVGDPVVRHFSKDEILLEHWQNEKQDRSGYLRGLAVDCHWHPENDRHWHYLGRELMWSGRPKSALKVFEQHVTMGKWQAEAAQSLVYMGDIHKGLGDNHRAVSCWHDAIQKDGSRREPWLRLASHYLEMNEPLRVACYAETSRVIGWTNYYGNRRVDYEGRPHELLYWAYYWLNEKERGLENWRQALRYSPTSPKILHDARFFLTLPKVSIVIPHIYGTRQKELADCLRHIELYANYPNYEVIVENDDLEERAGVAATFNAGVRKATGEYIMFLGDDCLPQPDFLIQAMLSMEGICGFSKEMRGLNDGVWCDSAYGPATHWVAHRSMLEWLPDGVFLHEGYHHVGCDNELTQWARSGGWLQWAERAKITHDTPNDEVHRLAWDEKKVKEDRKLLASRLEEYNL